MLRQPISKDFLIRVGQPIPDAMYVGMILASVVGLEHQRDRCWASQEALFSEFNDASK
jgi:hypothetical protein